MIVLDTNVVSGAMKPSANLAVIRWLDKQAPQTIFLSSVTLAELLYGIGILPEGRRRTALVATLDGLLSLFEGRILPFDADAARHYGDIAANARAKGRGMPLPDGYIAATAAAHGFAVATRDTEPFLAAGVAVIDPWAETH